MSKDKRLYIGADRYWSADCLLFGTFLISALLFGCAGPSDPEASATLTVALGGTSQHLASRSTASTDGNLPPDVTSIIVTISDSRENILAQADLLEQGKLSFKVPASIKLFVLGEAFTESSPDTAVYRDVQSLDMVLPGRTVHMPLLLAPVGAITHKIVYDLNQVDASSDGTPGDESSGVATFSNDNRQVAFHSKSSNLTSQPDNNKSIDFFIKDLVSGAIHNLHTDSDGNIGNNELTYGAVSGAADVAVFASRADNLLGAGNDTNNVSDIFLKDIASHQTTRISVTASGLELDQFSAYPTISHDGNYIAFYTNASLTADDNTGVFLVDRSAGGLRNVHVDSGWMPRISGDGAWVVYRKDDASNQTWIYNRSTGTKQLMTSYATLGIPAHDISFDGNYVVFDSIDPLDELDTNDVSDIYLYHRDTHTLQLISTDRAGIPLNVEGHTAFAPSLAGSGSHLYVAFLYGSAYVTDNVPHTDNATVYVKDVTTGELATVENRSDHSAISGIGASLSADGELVAFTQATDKHLYIAPNPIYVKENTGPPPVAPIARPVQGLSLTVTKGGDGKGTVVSDDNGINCGIDCNQVYALDAIVTLTPTPDEFSVFDRWAGDCVEMPEDSLRRATVNVSARQNCSALFKATSFELSLQVSDAGTVTGSPGTLSCASQDGNVNTCKARYNRDVRVALTPQPGGGNRTVNWSGCSEPPTANGCVVQMTSNKVVTVDFNPGLQHLLTLKMQGTGAGYVYDDYNLHCADAQCEAYVDAGITDQLVASPSTGSEFAGWSGDCSMTGSVLMDGPKTCTATFNLISTLIVCPQLKVGDQWTSVTNLEGTPITISNTETVTKNDGAMVETQTTNSVSSDVIITKMSIVDGTIFLTEVDDATTVRTYSPPLPYCPPPPVNLKVTAQDRDANGNVTGTDTITITAVTKATTVTVPAGTFTNAVKVDSQWDSTDGTTTSTGTSEIYVSDKGVLKEIETVITPQPGTIIWELTSYSLQ